MIVATDDKPTSGKAAGDARAAASGGESVTLHNRERLAAAMHAAPPSSRMPRYQHLGMTRRALAEHVGVHHSFIDGLLAGRYTTMTRVVAESIARAVHVPFGDLFVSTAPNSTRPVQESTEGDE